jgi:hypothetical protein
MDPFAAVPSTPMPLNYVALNNQFKENRARNNTTYTVSCVNTNLFHFFAVKNKPLKPT